MSLLTVDNGVFEVLASHGDTYLGGEDFDQRVMQHFIKIFNKKTNTDMQKDKRAMQRLRREVETVKRATTRTVATSSHTGLALTTSLVLDLTSRLTALRR